MGAHDFVAIDFETANSYLNSACSVGIAIVKNLCIVDSFYSLIKPPKQYFEDNNVKIHGITPDMTESAPSLDELWHDISQYFSTHTPVVAHNAHFDMSVLRQSTCAEIPNFPYIDSMDIAAPLVGGKRSLDYCSRSLAISLENHHNASSDAEVAAQIAIRGMQSIGCISMWEFLAQSPHVAIHRFSDLVPQKMFGDYKKVSKQRPVRNYRGFSNHVRLSDIHQTVSCIDCSNPLFEKTIVFTGELSIERAEAMQIAVNAGAIIRSSVSRKTDFLVVGIQDTQLVGEDGLSTKEEKAYALNNAGTAHIEIIDEKKFMQLVTKEAWG